MQRLGFWLLFFFATSLYSASAQTDIDLTAREQAIIAAAQPAAEPQFNGPKIVGLHPGMPLIYSLSVSGDRPLTFSTHDLPNGLTLDPATGVISGTVNHPGEYKFKAAAKTASGKAETEITFVCGDTLALTPPLGWNSYDAYGDSVTEDEVLANARWMKEHLQPFGWDTIVIDFRWYDPEPTGDDHLLNSTRLGAKLAADEFGRLLPATNRFPSAVNGAGFKPLADQLHALGLKFGIHVMRGIPRQTVLANTKLLGGQYTATDAGDPNDKCSWCPDMFGVQSNAAGAVWYDYCVQLWASWGVDYIKVDDLSQPYHTAEIEMIHDAITRADHAIVFSTSPGATGTAHAGHIAANANLWRISGDFWDHWPKLNNQFDLLAEWQGAAGAGHWPDADMIPLGHLGVRSKVDGTARWTRFSHDEQLTLMTLWALAPSPLMLGMNLPDNDDWTTALLTNPEVMAIDQDAAGHPGHRFFHTGSPAEIWTRQLANGSLAVGLFNRSDVPVTVTCDWHAEGFAAIPTVRDVWTRTTFPKTPTLSADLPPHGCMLLRVN